ncbi:MAG TPA: hypothetical protein VJ733_00275 [Candidatus Binatia bacterium]|nr:hypothetical protein [Candidatus Binatia bacterium]
MTSCNHSALELLPEIRKRLRCRYCHLTIAEEEIGAGFCPECFANSRSKRYDFEELVATGEGIARYRCEQCGAIVKSSE